MTTKRASKRKKPATSRKAKAVPPQHDTEPVDREWPPNLADTDADKLFDAIEGGATVRTAEAETLTVKPGTVYQWKHRYSKFAKRLAEAEVIGNEMILDEIVEISDTAKCRDTAAAAKEKREARMERLRIKDPQKHNISPFKPQIPGGGGSGGDVYGVILVPMKMTQERPSHAIIDSTAVRVPAKQLTAE